MANGNITLPSSIGGYKATDPTRLGWESVLWGQEPVSGAYRGTEYDYLTNLLKNRIGGQRDPALAAAEAAANRDVSQLGDTARRETKEGLASSGFRGSGANLINKIFATQADARQDIAANFGMLGMQQNQEDIRNLLGLNQFGGGQDMGEKGMYMGQSNFLRNLMQGGELGREQIEAESGFDWGGFAGKVVSAGAPVAIAL